MSVLPSVDTFLKPHKSFLQLRFNHIILVIFFSVLTTGRLNNVSSATKLQPLEAPRIIRSPDEALSYCKMQQFLAYIMGPNNDIETIIPLFFE